MDEKVKVGSVWQKKGGACWSPRSVVLACTECCQEDCIRTEELVCKGFAVLQMVEVGSHQAPPSQKGLSTITCPFSDCSCSKFGEGVS